MPHTESYAFARQRLSINFITLKHACPKGIYVAPVPERPLTWTGILFVREGPYAKAILRFEINFPDRYPVRPPVVTFLNDVFHPLIAPLTTYTYTSRDKGVETVSASDEDKLPPGGLSLRHGFPEWFGEAVTVGDEAGSHVIGDTPQSLSSEGEQLQDGTPQSSNSSGEQPQDETLTPPYIAGVERAGRQSADEPPHIIEVLQYMRVIFDTNALLDAIPIEAAANPGAWHAWKSYRARSSQTEKSLETSNDINRNRSMSPNKQQPGGARRPGEWNWTGVWEDRVKKAVQASISDSILYGGDESKVIDFVQLPDETYGELTRILATREKQAGPEQSQEPDTVTATAA